LSAAAHDLVAVVACDMPFVSAPLLAYQRDLLVNLKLDAVIPRSEGGTEPFHAIYRRATCLPAIERVIQADKWRVDAWYAQAKIKLLSVEEARPYDPHGLAYWNVNTPEEFSQAEQLARAKS